MTEAKTVAEDVQSWTKKIVGNEQGRTLVGEQMERAWTAEDKFVGEIHDYMEGWCERRHEAAQAAIDYAHKLANGADQSEIAKGWSELASATMKRFSDDAQAHFGFIQKMTSALSPGLDASALTAFGNLGKPNSESTTISDDKKSEKK